MANRCTGTQQMHPRCIGQRSMQFIFTHRRTYFAVLHSFISKCFCIISFVYSICLFVYLISVTHALRTSQTNFQIKSKQCSQMLTHSFCSGDGNFFVFFSNSAMRIFFSFFFQSHNFDISFVSTQHHHKIASQSENNEQKNS